MNATWTIFIVQAALALFAVLFVVEQYPDLKARHMFFGNGLANPFLGAFAPPTG